MGGGRDDVGRCGDNEDDEEEPEVGRQQHLGKVLDRQSLIRLWGIPVEEKYGNFMVKNY